jgi:hypothetical protein
MLELRRVSLGQETATDEEVTTTPIFVERGYVAIPTRDMQEFARSQLTTFAGGFVVGMAAGALFGNLLARRSR